MQPAPPIAAAAPSLAQSDSEDRAPEGDFTVMEFAGLSPEGVLDSILLGNSVRAWLIAIAILVALTVLFWVVRRLVAVRVRKVADRDSTWDKLIISMLYDVRLWLIFPAMVYVAARSLYLPAAVDKTIQIIMVVGVSVQLLLTSRLAIDFVLNLLIKRIRTQEGSPDPTVASSLGVLRVIAFAVVAGLVLLLALDNLGIEITPMLAGLGIGGIAVALALQSILGDLFGSLTIILDKPFVVGDFIIVDDKLGTVEKIGIKTTRVRALSGEQLVFSNNDLLSSRVQNFKRMFERRVVFEIGVIYETTPEQLRSIPAIIKEAIEQQDKTRFDRSHFKKFGAYSLDFETVYFVKSPDFNTYMDIQQAINLHIFEQFAAAGISFAYPTQVEVQRVERKPPPEYLRAGGGAEEHGKPADGSHSQTAGDQAPDPAGAPESGGD